MFDDEEFKEQAKNLGDAYMKQEYRKSILVSKSINIRALAALTDICKREKLGMIPLDFSGEEDRIYSDGDHINVLILSLQEQEFNKLVLEAYAVSGSTDEIEKKYISSFAKEMGSANAMLEIRNVDPFVYQAMKRQKQRLAPSLQFTMFPSKADAGNIDVAFFSKTESMYVNDGKHIAKSGPYTIPMIVSVVLACALLDDPEHEEEYKRQEEEKRNFINSIMETYYAQEDAFYLVPAIITKSGILHTFMDQNVLFDVNENTCPSYVEFSEFVIKQTTGVNKIVIPMTEMEYQKYRNEVVLNPKAISFFQNHEIPSYANFEITGKSKIQEQLIDVINRKREQILLLSDDFNNKNIANLENYISGSVNEIIMREDEDYSEWVSEKSEKDKLEQSLLQELEKYKIEYVYEERDKVTELIEAERNDMSSISSHEHEDELEK